MDNLNVPDQFKQALFDFLNIQEAKRELEIKLEHTRRGWFVSSIVPYGYNKNQSSLSIDTNKAETIRRIFSTAADGASYTSIAKQMNEDGVIPPDHSKSGWTPGIVKRIVKNTIYRGVLRYSTAEVYLSELRIVSDEEWEKAQRTRNTIGKSGYQRSK